ncbi:hypothetical protein [Streptomyces sp. NPDC001315]|uniref:hypothetical protein n=1 Tax=Streptomyces sp. NPDC001315 TaxID=3364562 RepID=UPI0036A15246
MRTSSTTRVTAAMPVEPAATSAVSSPEVKAERRREGVLGERAAQRPAARRPPPAACRPPPAGVCAASCGSVRVIREVTTVPNAATPSA